MSSVQLFTSQTASGIGTRWDKAEILPYATTFASGEVKRYRYRDRAIAAAKLAEARWKRLVVRACQTDPSERTEDMIDALRREAEAL